MDVRSNQRWYCLHMSIIRISASSQKLGITFVVAMVQGCIHMPIHNIGRCSNHLVYVQGDVTDISNLFYLSAYPSDGARGGYYVSSVKLGTCVYEICVALQKNIILVFLEWFTFLVSYCLFFHCFVVNIHMSQEWDNDVRTSQ